MTVFETIQEIIAEELDKNKKDITETTTFEEIDADSLDIFQIINDIEDKFDIEVDTEQDLSTVGELVKYVESNSK